MLASKHGLPHLYVGTNQNKLVFEVSQIMNDLFVEKTSYLPVLPKDPKLICIRNGSGQMYYYIFTETL